MAMPAFAAPVVQGNNTFTYSAEIDEAVNPVDQTTGEQEYLSLSAPTITFKDLDTIFPDRLSAMAFTADYSQGEKTAIFPGVLALNFTKDQILAYPNGNVIMTALQNSSDPVQTLFQYFDPVIVVNGPEGNTVSYNIKSFLSFNFMAENNWNAMTVTANIVLAGGYPKSGFFIEDINGYPFIFDTIVSETSQPKAVDGQIEFSLGLVPNGDALGTGITGKYPLMETDSGNGYVIFESPENYLGITEISAMNAQPAQLSSGTVSFTAIDDGVSFSIPYDNYPGVGVSSVNVFVYMPVSRLEELNISHEDEETLSDVVSVKIGDYILSPSDVSMLPDGSAFISAEFVLVDNDFVSDILVSGDAVIVFDGNNDGELEATVVVEKNPVVEDRQYVLGNTKILITPSVIEDNVDPVYDITGTIVPAADLPMSNGIVSQITPTSFEGVYVSTEDSPAMTAVLSLTFSRIDLDEQTIDRIEEYLEYGDMVAVMNIIRPVLFVGDVPVDIYNYLLSNGRSDLISISGLLDLGITISLPVVVTDMDEKTISIGESALIISDGAYDGKFTLKSYLGVTDADTQPEPASFSFGGASIRTDSSFVTDPVLGLTPVYEITGSFAQVDETPMEGMSDAINALLFTGTHTSTEDNPVMTSRFELSFKRADIPESIAVLIEDEISGGGSLYDAVLNHVRPVLFMGDMPFDVYEYLKSVGQQSTIAVSGYLDTGIYISFPVFVVDSNLSKVVFDSYGYAITVYDGLLDGKFTLKSYLGILEPAVPVQPSTFILNNSSLTVDPNMQVDDIPNFNPVFDVTGTFESVYLPVLEGMVPVSSAVFTGTYSYKANSFMPAMLEMAIMKNDLPDEVVDSIRKAVFEDGLSFAEAVLAHIHPVMMLGDSPFDVYEYLKVNNKTDLLTVSGSVDTGIYISLPVYVADAVPAKVTLGDNYLLLYDGEANGEFVLQFYVGILDIEQEEIIADKTFNFDNGSVTVTPSVEISDSFNAVYDVTGMFAETTMLVLPSFAQNLIPVKFEGAYVSDADNNAMPSVMETVFFRSDLPEEIASGIESALESGLSEAVLSYVRPIISVGNIQFDVYDYLKLNSGLDLMTVSGSLDTGVIISVPIAIVDSDTTKVLIDNGVLLLYDGNKDGKFVASFCIGVLKHEEEAGSVPEAVISAQGISVKTLPSFETDASVTRISQVTNTALLPGSVWPGREGFTDAVSVNGFILSYDNTGFTKPGALPVTLSVSVTANELSAISSENYNKVIAGEPFFDHFHVFKMVGSEVYDLNTIGGESMFTVTGDPVQKLLISFNAVLVDAEEQLPVVVSGDAFVFYDGEVDGELTDPLFIAAVEERGEEQEQVSVPYSHGSVTLTFDNELSFNLHPVVDVQGSVSETTLSLMDKFIRQVAPVMFEGQYQSNVDNNAVSGIWEFIVYGSDLPTNVVSAIKGSELSLREAVFEYIRPVILAGNIQFDVYDYLQTNGKTDLIGVTGSVDTGIVITVPFVVVDAPVYKVVVDDKYLVIYDGNADGKFVLKSYVGIIGVEEVEKPTVVLESPSLSIKTKPIDIPEDLDVEAIEDIEFEDAGYVEWPDKEGVLGGISVGSFVGEYDHNLYSKDGAVSVAVSVSVTPAELKGMFAKGKERYDKMLSEWLAGSKERFLDYYHVYKQIGDEIYDLVLIGGKEVFSLQGDPTTKITISFPAVLIDGEDISPVTFNSDISAFIVYDGKSDGQLTDPLFVGAPETVPTAEGETPEETEEETKHILPDNPAGPSTGHDDIGKWFKIFSLF